MQNNNDTTQHNTNPVFFGSLISFSFLSVVGFRSSSALLPRSTFLASSTRQSRPGALHVLQLQRAARVGALRVLACLGALQGCCCSPFRRRAMPRRLKIRVGKRTTVERRRLAAATAAAADIFLDIPPTPGDVLLHLKHKRFLIPADRIELPRVGVVRTGQRRRHAAVAAVGEAGGAGRVRGLGGRRLRQRRG